MKTGGDLSDVSVRQERPLTATNHWKPNVISTAISASTPPSHETSKSDFILQSLCTFANNSAIMVYVNSHNKLNKMFLYLVKSFANAVIKS